MLDIDCFLYVILELCPDLFGQFVGSAKDSAISFFLGVPQYEAWGELPDFIENVIVVRILSPILKGFFDRVLVEVGALKVVCGRIPQVC